MAEGAEEGAGAGGGASRPRIGVLGGMGPLASAELVHTIYRLNMVEPEQQSPACVLLSDPGIPDRTRAILAGDTAEVARRIAAALQELERMGAERMVIACVTAHAVLDRVPAELRAKVVSLLDLVADALAGESGPYLLLATTGTRRARIFERHARWAEIAGRVRFLDEADQERLHDLLYRFKQNEPVEPALPWLEALPGKYEAAGLIFGCTELHLLQRVLARREAEEGARLRVIDPLLIAAREVPRRLGYGKGARELAAASGAAAARS